MSIWGRWWITSLLCILQTYLFIYLSIYFHFFIYILICFDLTWFDLVWFDFYLIFVWFDFHLIFFSKNVCYITEHRLLLVISNILTIFFMTGFRLSYQESMADSLGIWTDIYNDFFLNNTGQHSFWWLWFETWFWDQVADSKHSISFCISGQIFILWYTSTSMGGVFEGQGRYCKPSQSLMVNAKILK